MKLCMSAKWVPMELISQLEPVQSSMFSVSISVFLFNSASHCLTCLAVPPTKAELVGLKTGSELVVKEQEEVELRCIIHNARPRPDIIWYLGDQEFVRGKEISQYFCSVISTISHYYHSPGNF